MLGKKINYSAKPSNPSKCVMASGKHVRVHYKNTYEVMAAIKKDKKKNPMKLMKAKAYLEQVLRMERCIPFRKYTRSVGRTAQIKEFKGISTQGRWPVKSVKHILNLIRSLEANAERKRLDPNDLVIEHAQVNRAAVTHRRTCRAHGKINPYLSHPCHMEIICRQVQDDEDYGAGKGKRGGTGTVKGVGKKITAITGGVLQRKNVQNIITVTRRKAVCRSYLKRRKIDTGDFVFLGNKRYRVVRAEREVERIRTTETTKISSSSMDNEPNKNDDQK